MLRRWPVSKNFRDTSVTAPSESLLDHFHAQTPIRTGSLIVSIFGDAVVPRGGVLSLSSLLEITRAFRIGDGLVRTALSRLVTDGWFERWKLGRNSFYRLTPSGNEAFAAATQRIYASAPTPWSGAFDLLILDGAEGRGGLQESGYGMIGPGLFVSAGAIPAADGALHLSAKPADTATARKVVAKAWPLDEIAARYGRFLAVYQRLPAGLAAAKSAPLDALVMRILLIHDFRRAVLRDPLLPVELLPEGWPGSQARGLCAEIYRLLVGPSEAWLDAHAENDHGALPKASTSFASRFR